MQYGRPPARSYSRSMSRADALAEQDSGASNPKKEEGLIEPRHDPVTLRTLGRMAERGDPFACLACYDAVTAGILERAGVHVLLLGDSGAQVVLGHERTISMPLDVAIAMTAGLKRGAPNTLIMGDMPFLSYTADENEALHNAGRFMTEGLADVVKLEVDASFAPLVRKMTRAGIPVCAHIGLLPQAASLKGGYFAAGRTAEDARKLADDAKALEDAGAVLLLIEAVPDEATQLVLDATSIPVIGIGAGDACHGQILVLHDLVGLTPDIPRFVEPTASLGKAMEEGVRDWVTRVAKRQTGGRRYSMRENEAQKLSGASGIDSPPNRKQ